MLPDYNKIKDNLSSTDCLVDELKNFIHGHYSVQGAEWGGKNIPEPGSNSFKSWVISAESDKKETPTNSKRDMKQRLFLQDHLA